MSENNSLQLLKNVDLESLRRFSSPTVANAIETFGVRSRDSGVSLDHLNCLFPELGTLVGYACTATILSAQPPRSDWRVGRRAYWEYLLESPGPRVVVMQDFSQPPAGAFWGEVNTQIHRRLGCTGLITNGAVRDLNEVRPQNFHMFATAVTVSHAYAHLEDFKRPVKIGRVLVQPGDLVHADQHGFVIIPPEIGPDVARVAAEIEAKERTIISLCNSPEFTLDKLESLISKDY